MPPKHTVWTETGVYVTKSFRLNKVLAHKVPSHITFTEDDSTMFFLAGSGKSCLFSVDLNQEVESVDKPLQHSQFFDSAYIPISREEELLRERQRICKNGITTFEYSGRTMLIPLGSNLYYHDMSKKENEAAIIKESENDVYLDTKLCPTDPRVISFIRDNDIYVTASHVHEYVRLTETHNSAEVYNGVPSFVVQEEFDRYTGYYWCPVQDTPDSYYVLYECVDETLVPSVRLSGDDTQVYKFPLAGQRNALASLKLARFSLVTQEAPSVERFAMREELHALFPWVEYIPWFGWHPSGSSVWCILLDRPQQHRCIVEIPVEYFTDHTTEKKVKIISEKRADTWLHVSDDIRFIDKDNFIYKHEEKYCHLYHVTIREGGEMSEVQLTEGEWSVTSLLDISSEAAFFHAQKNPIQQHLYRVELNKPGEVKQLTPDGFYHTCTLNSSKTQFASVFSNVTSHYECAIFSSVDGSKLKTITPTLNFSEVYLKKTSPQSEAAALLDINTYRYDTPTVGSVQVDGEDVYYMMYPAKGVDLTKPQPVLLYVYAGPEIQMVVDRFKGLHHRQQNLFATLGYTVIIADCPGSANRGKAWAEKLYKRMGTIEVNMQIKVVEALAKDRVYLDLSRVAVMGTSYGGYVALMALGQRSDFFKVAIAIAPAVSWHLYDTAYSERYMGLINTENDSLYFESSSVLNYVHSFPSEEHRLLIIHGLMDENVHFTHTTSLISELITAGKPYDLQVYPEERHGIGRGNAPAHCDTTIAVYLHNHLKCRSD